MDKAETGTPLSQARSGQRMASRIVLIVGDALSFLVFAAIGRMSHSESVGLFEVAKVAAPFMLGWFLVAPLIGAYRAGAAAQPATSEQPGKQRFGLPSSLLGRTALAWLVAWPLGLGLRAFFLQTRIPLTFSLITFITNLLLLMGWRSVFAWVVAYRNR